MTTTAPSSDRPTQTVSQQETHWQRAIELLNREAAAAPTDPNTCKIYLEIGNIYYRHLHQPQAALKAYQNGLRLNAGFPPLNQALENLATDIKDRGLFQQVINATEQSQQRRQDEISKAELVQFYLRIGRSWKEVFHDSDAAIAAFRKAHTLSPVASEPLTQLAQSLEEVGEWQDLADVYRHWIEVSQGEVLSGLRVKLHFLLFYKLNYVEEAMQVLQPLLQEKKHDYHILLLANKTLLRMQRWADLVENLDLLAEVTTDESLAKSYRLQRAEISHLMCNNNRIAVADLKSVLQKDPHNRNALEKLTKIYRMEQQYQPLVATLQRLFAIDIKEKKVEDVIARAIEIAKISTAQLKDHEKSIDVLNTALGLAPASLPIITALARHYRAEQQWESLKSVYEKELSVAQDDNERLSLNYRIGDLLEGPLNDVDGAVKLYKKALDIMPGYLPIHQRLIQIFTDRQQWQDLVDLHELELKEVDSDRRATILLQKIGSLYEERLQDRQKAADAYLRIVEINPKDIAAISALGRIYARDKDWEKVVEMNLLEANLCCDPKQSISLHFNSGMICEEKLGNQEMAIMCYQNALSISPTFTPALKALGNAYAKQQNWGGLIAMYHREAQVTSNAEKQLYLLSKVAEIYRERLRDEKNAEKTLRDILMKNPNHMPAVRQLENLYTERSQHERLVSLYKDLVTHEGTHPDTLGEVNLKLAKILHLELNQPIESEPFYLKAIECQFAFNTAITALDQIYSQAGRYHDLADLLTKALQMVSEPTDRFELLYRLAILELEQLQKSPAGIAHLLEAHQLRPQDASPFWDLCRYLEREKAWERLSEVILQKARHTDKPVMKQELMNKAAHYLEKAGNLKRAIELGQRIIQESSEDVATMELLIRLYNKSGKDEELAELLSRRLALITQPQERLVKACELASIYEERLQDINMAISVLESEAALETESQFAILMRLEHLLQKEQNWTKLASLYPKLIAATKSRDTRLNFELKHGQALEQLDKPREALQVYQARLAQTPEEQEVRQRVLELQERLEMWQELIASLTEVATLQSSDPSPPWRIGEIYTDKLHDNIRAVEHLQQAIKRDPEFLPVYESLWRVYKSDKSWQSLLDITSEELQRSNDPERVITLRLDRARVLRDEMNNADDAVSECQYGINVDASNYALHEELVKSYIQLENWQKSIQTYDKLIELCPQKKPELLYQMGEIALTGLKDEAACINYNEQALAIMPYLEGSLGRLRAIYTRNESWEPLIAIYQKGIEKLHGEEPMKSVPLHTKLAEIYEASLDQPEKAAQEFSKAIQIDKNYLPARRGLGRVFAKDPQNYPLAIAQLVFLLKHEKFQQDHFKNIARMFEETSKFDHLCRTYEAMELLQILTQQDREIYLNYAARIPKVFSGSLEPAMVRRFLFHPDESQPLQEFVLRTFPELSAFGRQSCTDFGLKRRDRVTMKEQNTARQLVNDIAQALQIETVDLYLKTGLEQPIVVIFDKPPALIVDPQWLRSWNQSQQSFQFGKELSLLLGNRGLGLQLGAAGFERLLRLLLMPFLKVTPTVTPELEEDMRRLRKFLSRRTRKWVEENAARFAAKITETDFKAWIRGIHMTSYRAGLLFAINLQEAVTAVSSSQLQEAATSPWECEVTREMILYSLSDECGNLRKALGTSIYSV